jgi:hypothetical protein
MKSEIYIPPSCKTADKHLELALNRHPKALTKTQFVRAWCSLAYLYPGLHPEGFRSEDSGWPKKLKPLAAEAWRRARAGQINDNQLFCYQACKARLIDEVGILQLESNRKPWFFTDHFSA